MPTKPREPRGPHESHKPHECRELHEILFAESEILAEVRHLRREVDAIRRLLTPPLSVALGFIFSWEDEDERYLLLKEGNNMQFTMQVTNAAGSPSTVSVLGTPVDVNGNSSQAALSGTSYVSSDLSVFTVAPDPNVPGGAIITAVAAGTATLTETATATEPDGVTTEQVQGVATIILTTAPPPPPAPAAAITFAFGVPA